MYVFERGLLWNILSWEEKEEVSSILLLQLLSTLQGKINVKN